MTGQTDDRGVPKPGRITVLDAASFMLKREINGLGAEARGRWNNPHNLWSDARHDVVYNTNWFGDWVNKIDRATGTILSTMTVGEAPTHIVTNPNEFSAQAGLLTCPLSADNDLRKLADSGELRIVDSTPTGEGKTHPHGQWITADGSKVVVPNVFKGLGFGGSISILDTETGAVLKELTQRPTGLQSAILMPVAVGIQGSTKAYVANIDDGGRADLAGEWEQRRQRDRRHRRTGDQAIPDRLRRLDPGYGGPLGNRSALRRSSGLGRRPHSLPAESQWAEVFIGLKKERR